MVGNYFIEDTGFLVYQIRASYKYPDNNMTVVVIVRLVDSIRYQEALLEMEGSGAVSTRSNVSISSDFYV